MRVIRLQSENIKRLHAIDITPTGDVITIGGDNAQGKSSVLDSIAMALGGKDVICEKPLREGADKGKVLVDLGDIVVERTFTPAGTALKVKSKDGATYGSPQTMLDNLVGRLSFDPLAFSRLKPAEQMTTLKQMVGLDFSALDRKRQEFFDKRTDVGRSGKAISAQLAAMPDFPDAPAVEVNMAEITAELKTAQTCNGSRAAIEQLLAGVETSITRTKEKIETLLKEAEDMKARAVTLESQRGQLTVELNTTKQIDLAQISEKFTAADLTNRKVRSNIERLNLGKKIEQSRAQWDELTRELEKVDAAKQDQIKAAAFPIPGLSFTETGVLFNAIPFAQASAAEQLRVSIAISAALNPKLKVVLIRDGSLLDEKSLKLVAEIAAEHGLQVWIEAVSKDEKRCTVIIEDGAIAAKAEAKAAQ